MNGASIISEITQKIVITQTVTNSRLLALEHGGDAFCLYNFYCHTASVQGNKQVYATNNYCKKGLGWGMARIKRAKQILKDQGVIEVIKQRDESNKITAWYIKINYISCQPQNEYDLNLKTRGSEMHPVEKESSNAIDKKRIPNSPNKVTSIKNFTPDHITSIAKQYSVEERFVLSKLEDLKLYCETHGKRYKNYYSALQNFVKKDSPQNKKVTKQMFA